MSGRGAMALLLLALGSLGTAGAAQAEVSDRPDLAALAAEIAADGARAGRAPPAIDTPESGTTESGTPEPGTPKESGPTAGSDGGQPQAEDTAAPADTPLGPDLIRGDPVGAPVSGQGSDGRAVAETAAAAALPGLDWSAATAEAWDFPASATDLAERAAASLDRIGAMEAVRPARAALVCGLLTGITAPGAPPGTAVNPACEPTEPGG